MAHRVIATLAAASALYLAGSTWAQSGGSGSGSGAGSSTPIEEGDWSRVKSVDADAGKVVVDNGAPLQVDKSTRVTRDGVTVSISDVRPGDEVRAAYLHGKDEGPITELNVRSKKHPATKGPGSSK